jgi:hypothetical protein
MSAAKPDVDLSGALPGRPVAVRRVPQTMGPVAMLGPFGLLLGLLALVVWGLGPDVARDWRIRGDAVPAVGDARVEEARCRSWLAVIKVCTITYSEAAGAKRSLWYLYIGAPGEESIALQRSRSDPALVTTDVGLERLISRSLTFAVLAGSLLLCLGFAVQAARGGSDLRRGFASLGGQRLTPVVVEIEHKNLVPPRRRLWVYLYEDGGTAGRAAVELPSKETLVFLTSDERWAVAVRGERGGTPMLLDSKLAALDLTEAEKAAFHAACRGAFRA